MVTHVVLLARDLDVRVVRLMESGVAVLVGAVRPGTVAAVEVPVWEGKVEHSSAHLISWSMVNAYVKDVSTLYACGGIKLRSVDEPDPGVVGFVRVVSTKRQFSPLKRQGPESQIPFSISKKTLSVKTYRSASNCISMTLAGDAVPSVRLLTQ